MNKTLLFFLTLFLSSSCSIQGGNPYADADPVIIRRFDKDLYHLIETNDKAQETAIRQSYPLMLAIFGKGVLNIQHPEMPGFFDKLVNYFSEPTLNGLYKDAIAQYDSIADIEKELGQAFAWCKDQLPGFRQPIVYMHISGFNQNVLTGEGLLSLSIDKYLGTDYPLYANFFYPYQRLKMQRLYVVPDYLTGWLMTEYPFTGKEAVLLERMVYEGKLKYLVAQAIPDRTPAQLLGMTEEGYAWCKQYEETIWKTIIERKHLYTPDQITTARYFEDTPATFLSDQAPGNIGTFIGWQIVARYLEETKATPAVLLQADSAQEILAQSKYKP